MGPRRSAVAIGVVASLGMLVCAGRSSLPAGAAAPSSAAATALLVISIDGLRHDYLDGPLAGEHPLPTLRRLRDGGAHARTVHGVWPSVTYPAHATLMTGATPAHHGILNNVVFDPFERNEGGWYWYARDLRVPALWDVARDAGIPVGNVTWPVTVGANIAWNLPQFWRAKVEEDEKLLAELSTPGLYAEAAPGPGEHRPDRARADAALVLLRKKHPGLTLVYFADLDTAQHDHGPMSKEAWRTLEDTDALVGELVAAAASGPSTVAIVSDHGFVPVDTDVRPNVALREAGLLAAATRAKDGRTEDVLVSYDAVTWKAGGSAAIMGKRGRQEPTASRVRALFERLASNPESHIGAVLDGGEVERAGGFPGAIVVLQAAPGATFSERFDPPMIAPSKYRGMHGHRPELAEMGPAFLLWGEGVAPGDLGEVEMIDIGPTLAALLGQRLPLADGKPIAKALKARTR
jgi:predicted AlkP superfamily pyrophosphatase or phosphodiesterase